METRFAFSRREGLRAAVPLLLMGGFGSFAAGVQAQIAPGEPGKAVSEPTRDRDLHLKRQGEDILLLEAIHALRLSLTQLKKLQPLANTAEELLTKQRTQDEETMASLERILQKQWEALVKGEAASFPKQQEALNLMSRLQTHREQAEQEVVRYVLPRLLPLLSKDQVLRAELLVHGLTPPRETLSPALADPRSGFVLPDHPKSEWLTAQLARSAAEGLFTAAQESYDVEILSDPGAAGAKLTDSQRNLQQAQEAVGRIPAPTEVEAKTALEPLVRRIFLSPRLKSVLQERVQGEKN
ncbi:MAG TPA: hypothetical protein VKU00_14165 [Chthonomonadaceae bacterium]|nr:hypothetical protein [Chthonomonadaceae bacterium]